MTGVAVGLQHSRERVESGVMREKVDSPAIAHAHTNSIAGELAHPMRLADEAPKGDRK